MKIRKLGNLEVSALGLGCWGMSGAYGNSDRKEAILTILESVDRGVNFLDTADVYGSGHNEELVAEAISGIRDKVVLATKFGYIRNNDGSMSVRCDPKYVKIACENSLRRLKTDYIDLYYMHRLDKNIPIEETVGAMKDLLDEGKIKHIGLSEVSALTISRAVSESPISAIQSEYSLFTRDVESGVLQICKENDIGFVPFSPLSRAMLTGKYKTIASLSEDDFRLNQPRWQKANFNHNIRLVETVEKIALDNKIKPSQLALAWLLIQGNNIVPIPGMKTRKYLDENFASVNIEVRDSVMDLLNSLSFEIEGERYTDSSYKFLDI